MKKNKQAIIFCIAIFLLSVFALSSCSSMKKSQQHEQQTHDSAATETKSNAAVKTVDSISKKKNDVISYGGTVIEFEKDNAPGNYEPADDSSKKIDPKDYAPVKKPVKQPVKNIIHLPGGGKIETGQNIKSISGGWYFEDSGGTITELHKKDTAAATETKAVTVNDSSESSESWKSKTNFYALLICGVLVIFFIIAIKRFTKKIPNN